MMAPSTCYARDLQPQQPKAASMKQSFIYVGLDVDDTLYHGSAFDQHTGAGLDFHCRPTLKGLLRQLEKLRRHVSGCAIRVCDDASSLGSTLQRD